METLIVETQKIMKSAKELIEQWEKQKSGVNIN